MGKLTCSCLNVKIHTKRTDLNPASRGQLDLDSDIVEGFFSLQITDAPLDLEGVRIEHPCLVTQESVSDWIVNKCHNCDMYTHASKPATHGTSKVLVNCSLKGDPTIQERLETSPDYSSVYKIVLPNQIDNRPIGTVGVHSDKYDSAEKALKAIQSRLESYLLMEKTAMENRIRDYQERQKAAFDKLESKARKDKQAMLSMVLSTQRQESNESGYQSSMHSSQDEIVTSPMSVTSPPVTFAQNPALTKSSKSDFSFLKQPNKAPSPMKTERRFIATKPAHDNDDDELFNIDGIDDTDDSRPFYNSDDENDTDDSNSLNDEGVVPHVQHGNLYSSSVPISVPSWREMRQRNSSIDEDDEDEDDRTPAPDPENMAASISALARSVHSNTSDIFGERPRRKVSVLEMGRP